MVSLAQAGTMSKIQQYENGFKELKKRFIGQEIVQIDIRLLRCLEEITEIQNVLHQIQSDSRCATSPLHCRLIQSQV